MRASIYSVDSIHCRIPVLTHCDGYKFQWDITHAHKRTDLYSSPLRYSIASSVSAFPWWAQSLAVAMITLTHAHTQQTMVQQCCCGTNEIAAQSHTKYCEVPMALPITRSDVGNTTSMWCFLIGFWEEATTIVVVIGSFKVHFPSDSLVLRPNHNQSGLVWMARQWADTAWTVMHIWSMHEQVVDPL